MFHFALANSGANASPNINVRTVTMKGKKKIIDTVKLSEAERQVLQLLVEGFSIQEIMTKTGLPKTSVDRRLSKVKQKLQLFDRIALAKWAIRNGIGSLETHREIPF